MKLRRNQPHHETPTSHLEARLRELGGLRATGALSVQTTVTTVVLFLFEGGVYAAHADSFIPRFGARFHAAGWISSVGEHDDLGALIDGSDITPEMAAMIHQETMLATIDVLLGIPDAEIIDMAFHDNELTDRACTLPIDTATVFSMCDARRTRAREDFQALGVGMASIESAGAIELAARGSVTSQIPELMAFAEALGAADGQFIALDELAGNCGFTRAEALHLARRLNEQGAVEVRESAVSTTRPLVPEAAMSVPAL